MKKLSILRPSSLDSFALDQAQPSQPIINPHGGKSPLSNFYQCLLNSKTISLTLFERFCVIIAAAARHVSSCIGEENSGNAVGPVGSG